MAVDGVENRLKKARDYLLEMPFFAPSCAFRSPDEQTLRRTRLVIGAGM